MRWGYGGRRWSYDGEGGGGSELDAPRTKNGERRARATLTVDEAYDGVGRPDSGGRGARTAMVDFGPGDGAVGMSDARRLSGEGAVGASAARARRAVRTRDALSRQWL
jgi:hypothetical protein